jgi:hypothetical protein
MRSGVTGQTVAVSLLIRKVQVRILPGAPKPQVTDLQNLPGLLCVTPWSFFGCQNGMTGGSAVIRQRKDRAGLQV